MRINRIHFNSLGNTWVIQKLTASKKMKPPVNKGFTGGYSSYSYLGWESNPHSRKNWILNPARLPIPPPRLEGSKVINYLFDLIKINNNAIR